ncbi:MAG: uracil-DNA glycosylase [Bacillota bacterium]|nr:uracil-DNA glycosylase [Bacillota bacterium]HHU61932.1 uracil-DNA glycosylase [Natronincola sp.]
MNLAIGNDWDELLKEEFIKPYYLSLRKFLKEEYLTQIVYPKEGLIFEALRLTSFAHTKVIILGQDPYHGEGQAHGLAFSVQEGVAIPPSLRNIFKELNNDVGTIVPQSGCLKSWAQQGVLLLNNTLTVRAGQAGSHRGKGWEEFTSAVISLFNEKKTPVVFLLWGKDAEKKGVLINNSNHLVLRTTHPSPLSAYRGFLGSAHFSRTNDFLIQRGLTPITW